MPLCDNCQAPLVQEQNGYFAPCSKCPNNMRSKLGSMDLPSYDQAMQAPTAPPLVAPPYLNASNRNSFISNPDVVIFEDYYDPRTGGRTRRVMGDRSSMLHGDNVSSYTRNRRCYNIAVGITTLFSVAGMIMLIVGLAMPVPFWLWAAGLVLLIISVMIDCSLLIRARRLYY